MAERGKSILKTAFVKANRCSSRPECQRRCRLADFEPEQKRTFGRSARIDSHTIRRVERASRAPSD